MDEIRAIIHAHGRSLQSTIKPSYKIFASLLLQNEKHIKSITPRTVPYGTHPRQTLDIYQSTNEPRNAPMLLFLYGGGFIRGDKILSSVPEGLVYRNLGTFFATRGFTTVIADYRRVNSAIGGEDAVFPSGGKDVSLVLEWAETFDPTARRDLFIMGNSAGGVHLTTFLLLPEFFQQRERLLSGVPSIVWKGNILLSVPFHFSSMTSGMWDMLPTYYGSASDIEKNCPLGLLRAIKRTRKSREETCIPNTITLAGEYDPVDDILEPGRTFVALCNEVWETGMELTLLDGHNHVSPFLALSSGDTAGENWAGRVITWMHAQSSKSRDLYGP
ncbi:Alpha/Beta hydrolase protein [Aspergillus californicus]